MKANELRIGNWVLSKDGRHIQMNRDMFGVVPLLTPIPLTPEVLEKCKGFEKDKSGDYVFLNYYKIQRILKGYIWAYGFSSAYCVELKYLHQLQNLIFALTGEELIYKP